MNLILLIPILLGWLSGWLVNYLADVLPVTRKLSRPECPNCHKSFSWKDYLFFTNCKTCSQHRNIRFVLSQIILTALPILLWLFPRAWIPFPLAMLLLAYLAVVFVIDVEHRLILHPVSLAGGIIGLGTGVYINMYKTTLLNGIIKTLIGGAVGFGIMLVFYFLGEWYVKRMSQKRGLSPDEVALGFGDVNLSGVLGMLLGWPNILAGLLFSIFAGGLISLVIVLVMLISKKYKAFTAIPYAPFLILGALYLIFL
jgi:leader peptidase (prepilin peptidase) / N-methyltransferase